MKASLAILGAGMVTGVGLSAAASCAAIRCGINNFDETRFMDRQGVWIIGSQVPLEPAWRGPTRLAKMAASAISECLDTLSDQSKSDVPVPLVLCLAESDRPGRLEGLGAPLLFEIEKELSLKFHAESSVLEQGRVGGALALRRAQALIQQGGHPFVIIAGVDTYLTAATLADFESRNRLLTALNSNGFIAGEGASAVLLAAVPDRGPAVMVCKALGFARESATIDSETPLRGDGMVEATRTALAAAAIGLEDVDYRVSDLSGEEYRFREVALATNRILRQRKVGFGILHPADCVGEIGAAALPTMLGVLHYGLRKRYLPGRTFLAHLSNDDDKRAAAIVSVQELA